MLDEKTILELAEHCFVLIPGVDKAPTLNSLMSFAQELSLRGNTAPLPEPIARPGECTHEDFSAFANIVRLTDEHDKSIVKGYTAEVRINCIQCGKPFEFIGVDAGMMSTKPMCSLDAQELRAPIQPKGMKLFPAVPGFRVRVT